MDFCFVVNDKYVTPLIVTLQSIVDNNSGFHRFFIISSGLMEENVLKLSKCAEALCCKIEVITVDDTRLGEVPILRNDFNKTPYYKLLLPLYLPQDIDKVLYLDVDIIINRDLKELFNSDLGSNYFAAVPDPFINKRNLQYVESLGIIPNEGNLYFNSGVILFNMSVFRKVYNFDEVLSYIKANGKNFKFHDQEVLNGLFFKNYIQLDETYNYLTVFRGVGDALGYLVGIDKNPTYHILHYANSFKPWSNAYLGKYEKEYWKYASKSFVCQEICQNKKKRVLNQINAMLSIAMRKINKLFGRRK
ncbi:lPS:glycosyltransferase [Ruminococcus sp. CAG:353]|uniref:glycosyltransferase family 8 protein n=1 Tax=Huintestinicola butyrica TaxID=2981728 RepID=UPI00033B5C98|nr:glycosyltransferase family 8 protein [Huintestinicola butyrica]MCU6728264.1 glycosyltransferase family 8 protein [Huintestinicola butyrica]MEE0294494.1 glycosyltransferase family 8 protein [Eubacterium sp.]CDE81776.1 lPS:glycosyltransferase [Ruminococcus sp. CAG:353]SCJ08911.1 General stress protein A [uncultured Ruminococcus sp.]